MFLNRDKTEMIVFGNKEKKISISKHLDSWALKTKVKLKKTNLQ